MAEYVNNVRVYMYAYVMNRRVWLSIAHYYYSTSASTGRCRQLCWKTFLMTGTVVFVCWFVN